MQSIIQDIKDLLATISTEEITSLEKLPQSVSDSFYFRLVTPLRTYIATFGKNIR